MRSNRNKNGGGVAIYIRSTIPYVKREDLLDDILEWLRIELRKRKSKPVFVCPWYRPPSAKIELFQNLENILEQIDYEDKDIIFTGNLNCNLLEQVKNQATCKLLNVLDIFKLQQLNIYKLQPELLIIPRPC